MTSIPVAYGTADLLKISVTFNYDRYIINPGSYSGSKSNKKPTSKQNPVAKLTKEQWTYPQFENGGNGTNIDYGNTYGPGSNFVPRDSATGVPI
jgi:hypothetical protein